MPNSPTSPPALAAAPSRTSMPDDDAEAGLRTHVPTPSERTDTTQLVAADTPVPSEKMVDPFEVAWDGEDDQANPLNMPKWRKWASVLSIAISCVCVTCCSSMASMTYAGMERDFHVGTEVCTLSVSLFVFGLGCGPLLLGPVSEFMGRRVVLHGGFAWFALLNLPLAFANNIAVHMIFRFFTGFAGSGFLSVSGGAITDMFHNTQVATPMLLFTAAPFLGPVLGPLIAGFINEQQPDWRWTYYVVLIWAAVCLTLLFIFLPETYAPQLLKHKAAKLRKHTGDERHKAPIEKLDRSFIEALKRSLRTPFSKLVYTDRQLTPVLLTREPMVLFLDLWSALILGILYLSFGGIPYIFRVQHGFNLQETGMAFLGIGAGMLIACATQPYWNRNYKAEVVKYGGSPPPEVRLRAGMYGAVICPLGLLLLGLTAFKSVHWIVPIILSSFFGWGLVYAFTATFTYLVDAYRPVAASALASNSFLRSSFAGGFPLFGQQMYKRLGPVGATCLLAGLLFLFTPCPFIFYRIGARVRARSKFSAT